MSDTQFNVLVGVFGGNDKKLFEMTLTSDLRDWSKPAFNFLWKKQLNYYDKIGDIITWPVLKKLVAKAKLTDQVKALYLSELKKLFDKEKYKELKKDGLLKYSVAELNAIQRNTDFFNTVKEHAVAINSGNVEDLNDALDKTINQLVSKLINKKQSEYIIIDYAEDFEQRQKARYDEKNEPDKYQKFRYRYKSLNDIFVKGHRGGDLVILSGITGVGKSIMSIDIATQAAEQGLNTIVFTSENAISQTCGRLDANITGYKYDLIQAYGFEDDADRVSFEKEFKQRKDIVKHIKILKMDPNNFTVVTMMRAMHELKEKGFDNVKVVIIDSPDLMRPSVEFRSSNDSYGRVSKSLTYWEIKGMLLDNDLIGFCTSQLTREVGKRKDPLMSSAEDIAEAYDKVRIADVMLLLLETVELALNNQIAIKVGKNRDGIKPIEPTIMRIDKSRMRFYDSDGERIDMSGKKMAKVHVLKPVRKMIAKSKHARIVA